MTKSCRPFSPNGSLVRWLTPVLSSLLLALPACGGGEDAAETPSGGAGVGGKSGAAGKGGGGGKGGAAGTSGAGGKAGSAGGKAGGGGSGLAAGASGAPGSGAGGAGSTGGGAAGGGAATGGAAGAGDTVNGGAGGGATGGGAAGSSGSANGGSAGQGGSSGAAPGGGAGGSGNGKGGASGGSGAQAGAAGVAGTSATGGGAAGVGGKTGTGGASGKSGAGGAVGGAGGGPPVCKLPTELCGETCVDVSTDAKHCGSCGAACPDANGKPTCEKGACKLACTTGFADCDGDPKNGCEITGTCACVPGAGLACYEGAPGTQDVGVCKGGKKVCNAQGTGYGDCAGQIVPAKELCDGGLLDENCNGKVNEVGQDPACACDAGSQVNCYDGPVGTQGVGVCKGGKRTCNELGTAYGACEGQVVPSKEVCAVGNTADEDCNGKVNDPTSDSVSCACEPGTSAACYDGPGGLASAELTAPSGLCKAGLKACTGDGTAYGVCQGQILASPEVCDEALFDEDCNGQVNEGGAFCECVPGTAVVCFDGPNGAVFGGSSICKQGMKTCGLGGKFGLCEGQVLPGKEPLGECTANIDEDCNGDAAGPGAVDQDGDGWTACQGDCCEILDQCTVPSLVNPGAYDVTGNNFDDDCDGIKDNPVVTCDSGLASNSGNALDYAKAMDLCQFTVESPPAASQKKWGVISASLTLADGTGVPAPAARSIRTGFGSVVTPKGGSSFAVLSTGTAADATDTNPSYQAFQGGTDMGKTSSLPADWLAANGNKLPNAPGCPPPVGGNTGVDPVMLTIRVRVPTNAKSFSFSSYFLSSEYPEWVCSPYNDFFVALLESSFGGTPANPADKNLAFYDPPGPAPIVPVGINLARGNTGLFSVCKNGPTGCAQSAVAGTNNTCATTLALAGTGMDILNPGPKFLGDPGYCGTNNQLGGATGYLLSSGNVKPGETITMRFAIWDTSDPWYDSVVLLDNWTWSLDATQPGTRVDN